MKLFEGGGYCKPNRTGPGRCDHDAGNLKVVPPIATPHCAMLLLEYLIGSIVSIVILGFTPIYHSLNTTPEYHSAPRRPSIREALRVRGVRSDGSPNSTQELVRVTMNTPATSMCPRVIGAIWGHV